MQTVYANDPRVTRKGDSFDVDVDGQRHLIEHGVFRWTSYTGPNLDIVEAGHISADDAIHALIGDPQ